MEPQGKRGGKTVETSAVLGVQEDREEPALPLHKKEELNHIQGLIAIRGNECHQPGKTVKTTFERKKGGGVLSGSKQKSDTMKTATLPEKRGNARTNHTPQSR